MKTTTKFLAAAMAFSALGGCMKNKDIEYPDYLYQTSYFATQYPIRTIVLGEDLFVDNSLDQQGKVAIKATTGGVRENTRDVVLDFSIDPSLTTGLFFPTDKGGAKVLPLPDNYYQLASNQITIPKGSFLGGVEVQLTDAFFDDPLALNNNYALPVRLTSAKGADSILVGSPQAGITNPNPLIASHWAIQPKNFTVYALKFVNQWHGNYLRRGNDVIAGGVSQTIVRHKPYVENDEVNKLTTKALKVVEFPVVYKNALGNNITCPLLLTFDNAGNCVVSAGSGAITASGSGKFVSKGEKNSWAGKDRDALYLDYSVNIVAENMQIKSLDTLVMRDRSVNSDYFSPVIK
jgi:hypothetical protein